MVVNVDDGRIVRAVGDEGHVLPRRLHRALGALVSKVLGDAERSHDTARFLNILLPEAFQHVFVECFTRLFEHVLPRTGASTPSSPSDAPQLGARPLAATPASGGAREPHGLARWFMRERFLQSTARKSLRAFLEWYTESTFFHVFLNDYLDVNTASFSMIIRMHNTCTNFNEKNTSINSPMYFTSKNILQYQYKCLQN